MKQRKKFYKSLPVINGYVWRCFADGRHSFTKRAEDGGFWLIQLEDEDIEDGSWIFLLEKGLSLPIIEITESEAWKNIK